MLFSFSYKRQGNRAARLDNNPRSLVRVEALLLLIYVVCMLCLQAFNTAYPLVGHALGDSAHAGLLSSLPAIVLGVVCFMYASLADFVSLRKMVAAGICVLSAASVFGFLFHGSLWAAVVARVLQVGAGQVAGSVYLVVAARYALARQKALYIGLLSTMYQLAVALGVFVSGMLSASNWYFVLLVPLVSLVCLPYLWLKLPEGAHEGHTDVVGFTLFGAALTCLTLFFSFGQVALLGMTAVLGVGFALYCTRATEPFVTPAFLKNPGLLSMLFVVGLLYVPTFLVPHFIVQTAHVAFDLTATQMALWLIWANAAGAVAAAVSGPVMGRLGAHRLFLLAGLLFCGGLAGCAGALRANIVCFVLMLAVFYCGLALIYTAQVETILFQIAPEEAGRGIGTNDLLMNFAASLGVTFLGPVLNQNVTAGVVGALGTSWLVFAVFPALGVVVYLLLHGRTIRAVRESLGEKVTMHVGKGCRSDQ